MAHVEQMVLFNYFKGLSEHLRGPSPFNLHKHKSTL